MLFAETYQNTCCLTAGADPHTLHLQLVAFALAQLPVWLLMPVCRLARLMLALDEQLLTTHLGSMFGQLQEKVTWLTERPYLKEGMASRTLTLLHSLLQVCPLPHLLISCFWLDWLQV